MTTSGLAANGFLKQNDFLRESKLSIIAQVFRKARFPRRARRRRAAPALTLTELFAAYINIVRGRLHF
mgnify:CR=1 FL=1